MQTGFILLFSIFPIVLEGCCGRNQDNRNRQPADLCQETTRWLYKAVEGEMFAMPCFVGEVWSRTGNDRGGNEDTACGKEFVVGVKHSGNYTNQNGSLFLHLQVVEKISLGCFQPNEAQVELVNGKGGDITCPGHNCSNNMEVRWFKKNIPVSQQKRSLCQKHGVLSLCEVKADFDDGVFFCDRQITEHGVTWTMRRAVTVTVVPTEKATRPPRFAYPFPNTTEEVEFGKSHNLTCDVFFPSEGKKGSAPNTEGSAKVLWYVSYSGNEENMTLLPMGALQFKERESTSFEERRATRTAFIGEVTQQHLSYAYTCVAINSIGSRNVTIKLVEKKKDVVAVPWPSLVGGPVVFLVLVVGLVIVVHVKWLELKIIYRSHFPLRKHEEEEKKFDVFLSYVWSPPSPEEEEEEEEEVGGGPGRSAKDEDEAAHSSVMNPLNPEDGGASLQQLLPQVLEGRWGYRLFLLERDVLPGGVYTNDVALAIQRSQMLICVLSADYLCNNNAVFVLETGVQALLQNSAFKILLIRTHGESAAPPALSQQDPPLPTLVQRALKVLPSLTWTQGRPAAATCDFWRSLRKSLPGDRVMLLSQMQEQEP